MQNDTLILPTAQDAPALRTIEQITADIRAHARMAALSILSIGQDLTDAKAQLRHGEWLPWLREIGIAPKTAENYMRLAREVIPGSALSALPYSKALALLDIPADQREQFIADNNVAEQSAASIKRLIAEAKKEKERADQAEAAAAAAQKEVKAIESTLSGANTSNRHLRQQVEQLQTQLVEERNKPCDTITIEVEKEVAPADYEQMRRDYDSLRRRCAEAEDAAAEAEQRAASAVAEAQRMQMEQMEQVEQETQTASDALSLDSFISACNDFNAKVWNVPFMQEVFRSIDRDTLRAYRLFTNSVKSWSERALAAMDEAAAPIRVVIEGGEDDVR